MSYSIDWCSGSYIGVRGSVTHLDTSLHHVCMISVFTTTSSVSMCARNHSAPLHRVRQMVVGCRRGMPSVPCHLVVVLFGWHHRRCHCHSCCCWSGQLCFGGGGGGDSTLQCPSHSCRNPQESTGILRNPQEWHRNPQESSGMAPESAGILRNPQESTGMRLEWNWN